MSPPLDHFKQQFQSILRTVPRDFVRGIMDTINWKSRLIGIKGPRGVGKTVLMLQYIQKQLGTMLDQTLYVSLDNVAFANISLVDLADTFVKQGGKFLFLDEVHKYKNWAVELKNCYDLYPELNIVFTGSSLLEILNARADLSRRAIVYHMQGLSLREFMAIEYGDKLPVHSLDDILEKHADISLEINQKLRPLYHFDKYLEHGYFPFYREQPELYLHRINEVINMILEIELPLLRGIDLSYIRRLKQLMQIISSSVPFVPNVSKLSEKIGIDRKTLLAYLHYLHEVKLTLNLFKEAGGISKLQKPQKIYLDNTNLMYALNPGQVNRGNLRETFFANQLSYSHDLQYTLQGDFLIDEKYTFEIGGTSKSSRQIKGLEEAYLAVDGIEYGMGNKIPLWLFGFTY